MAPPDAHAEPPVLSGFLRASGVSTDAAETWLDGGFGKLDDGASPGEPRAEDLGAELRLALDWEPTIGWRLFVHGAARHDPRTVDLASASGLVEAFVEHRRGFGEGQELVARLGQFFLPTSRENVDPLWTSPYTLTLSTLNSWVAEELRPIGLDLSWRKTWPSEHHIEGAATVFGGNDTLGTIVAWRGFALHDRPTPTGRRLPLPPLGALAAEFPEQNRSGTRPFGTDLDSRPGYAARLGWRAPESRSRLQATALANRGDRALHGDEYAWDTEMVWLSAEQLLPFGWRLIGEWGEGRSSMGFAPPGERSTARVDVHFDLGYLLLSREWGALRTTVRYDEFRVRDLDSTASDDNSERGSEWTFAVLGRLGPHWRLGFEWLELEAERGAAVVDELADLDGRSLRVELRYLF